MPPPMDVLRELEEAWSFESGLSRAIGRWHVLGGEVVY